LQKLQLKLQSGYTLDEIKNAVTGKTYACFEPVIDYVVVKVPKWPFSKFLTANRELGTQMKATGEVMAIATNLEAGLMKSIRSLEENVDCLYLPKYSAFSNDQIREELKKVNNETIWVIAENLRRGLTIEQIHEATTIDKFFVSKINNLVMLEEDLKTKNLSVELLKRAKQYGYTDNVISRFTKVPVEEIKKLRKDNKIEACFKMVDTCAAEFDAETPYYYSSYNDENEALSKENKKKVLILGSGPIRIGQGIEFDYCSVHCTWSLKKKGYETIIINNNPETVSTDFDIADKLYFEPLTPEDVENVVNTEKPYGAIVQFGGQTAIKLTKALKDMGVKILGTAEEDMDRAEDRELFDEALNNCGILRPKGSTVYTAEEAIRVANNLGYPVLVRPSYVLRWTRYGDCLR